MHMYVRRAPDSGGADVVGYNLGPVFLIFLRLQL